MNQLQGQPWYIGPIPRDTVDSRITTYGDFIVRESTNSPGSYVIAVKVKSEVRHFKILSKGGMFYLSEDNQFPTIELLINTALGTDIGMGDAQLIRPAADLFPETRVKNQNFSFGNNSPGESFTETLGRNKPPGYTENPLPPLPGNHPAMRGGQPAPPPVSSMPSAHPIDTMSSILTRSTQPQAVAFSTLPHSNSSSSVGMNAGSTLPPGAMLPDATLRSMTAETGFGNFTRTQPSPQRTPWVGGLDYPSRTEYTSKRMVEVAVPGGLSEHSRAFADELAPDEQILGEFEVNIVKDIMENCCVMLLRQLLSCCTSYCCRRLIQSDRARLAVTSHRRILLWEFHNSGTQSCGGCCPMNTIYGAHTSIRHFSVDDLAFMQQQHIRQRQPRCIFPFCCVQNTCINPGFDSTLRLKFHSYPSSSFIRSRQAASDIGPGASMVRPGLPFNLGWIYDNFAFKRVSSVFLVSICTFLAGICSFWASCCFVFFGSLAFSNDADRTNTIEITSYHAETGCCSKTGELQAHGCIGSGNVKMGFDQYHNRHKDAFEVVRKIQELIAAQMPDCLAGQANPDMPLDMPSSKFQLLVDGRIQYNPLIVGIAPGERILDVCPRDNRWTMGEFFTLLALSMMLIPGLIYYFYVLKPRYRRQAASIITNRRIMSVLFDGKWTKEGSKKDFVYQADSYSLNGVSSVLMQRERKRVSGLVKTSYGTIKVDPQLKNGWNTMFYYGLSVKKANRSMRFISKLMVSRRNNTIQRHQVPISANENDIKIKCSEILEAVSLESTEDIVTYYKSQKVRFYNCCALPKCTKVLTCGIYPYVVFNDIIVTTHRLIARVNPQNFPFCCVKFWSIRGAVYISIPFHSTEMQGWAVDSFTSVNDTCFNRIFCCCCSRAQSRLELAFGLQGSFPIVLNESTKCCCSSSDGYGRLETPDMSDLQHAMASAIGGRSRMSSDGWRMV